MMSSCRGKLGLSRATVRTGDKATAATRVEAQARMRRASHMIRPTRTDYRKAIALVHPLPNFGSDLRLRRLICGKALPFRTRCVPNNFLPAGWKAEPSSLSGGGQMAGIGRKTGEGVKKFP